MGVFYKFCERLVKAATFRKIPSKDATFGTFLFDSLFFVFINVLVCGSITFSVIDVIENILFIAFINALSAILLRILAPKKHTHLTRLMTICLFTNVCDPLVFVIKFYYENFRYAVNTVYILATSVYYYNNLKPRGYKGFRLWFILIVRALCLEFC